LGQFGENNIRKGDPMAVLKMCWYRFIFSSLPGSRHQSDCGQEYSYALRGDGQPVTKPIKKKKSRHLPKDLVLIVLSPFLKFSAFHHQVDSAKTGRL